MLTPLPNYWGLGWGLAPLPPPPLFLRLCYVLFVSDLFHSEKDHAGVENNNDGKITRIESDLQKFAAAFQKYKTTALETKSNNYSETIKDQGIRISALEGN